MKKILLIILLITSGCGGEPLAIENFDREVWKKDYHSCENLRFEQAQTLLANKEVLLGRSNREIIDLLGKPDKTELYTRNQKFFHYYITSGKQCGEGFESREPAILTFRFNATGLAKEINIYN